MKSLPSFPLRAVPLLLLLFTGIIAAIAIERHYSIEEKDVEREKLEQLTQEMTRLQGTLENLFRKGDLEGAQQEISMMGSRRDLEYAILLDDQDHVSGANVLELNGRTAAEVLPRVSREVPLQVASRIHWAREFRMGKVFLTPDRECVIGYYPVVLGPSENELRSSRVGVLYMQNDLKGSKAVGRYEVEQQVLQMSLAWVSVAFLLWIFFHFFLTRRVNRLVAFTKRFSEGDFTARTGMSGRDELGEIGQALDQMAAQVDADRFRLRESEEKFLQAQKMEAVGRLAGGVAHDFNNLLTAILGYGAMLTERLESDHALQKMAGEIVKTGERAAALTRQLLTFSRRQIFQPRIVDLNEVLSNVLTMLRRVIGEDVDLVTDLRKERLWVLTDPVQVEQILMNLSVNSRDAMVQGGQLIIRTAVVDLNEENPGGHVEKEEGGYVMFSVSDNGCGMDLETRRHLFEPFYTTKEPGKGTGLGLSTVYGIVSQNNGQIRVESEAGKGSTFYIYLPRVVPLVEETEESKPAPSFQPSGEFKTILVVEDEEAVRSLICAILQEKGYRILWAWNGEEAIRQVDQCHGPIHLVITDVVMPVMSGGELARRLAIERPDIRILFVSGYPDDELLRQGITQENAAFLQKPFTPDALLRKTQAILRDVS